MLQNLKQRWKSECTKLGSIFRTWVAIGFGLVGAIATLSDYLSILPPIISENIPIWVKYVVLGAGIISHIGGSLTVAKPKDNNGQV